VASGSSSSSGAPTAAETPTAVLAAPRVRVSVQQCFCKRIPLIHSMQLYEIVGLWSATTRRTR
jgi:hypothetical protein